MDFPILLMCVLVDPDFNRRFDLFFEDQKKRLENVKTF